MAQHTVASTNDIPLGERAVVTAGNTKIIVFHLETGFYAIQAHCPHMFVPLKGGKLLDGKVLQCPFHRAQFDISDGEVVKWAHFPPGIQVLNPIRGEKCLKTYPVTLEGDKVLVEV